MGPAQGAPQAGQVVARVAEQQAHQAVQPLARIHVHREAQTRHAGTGLPAYSDTGYSDIPATVTVFRSHYSENPGYSNTPLTVYSDTF